MYFFLGVLFLMFHLVFMILNRPLQTLCRCQSPMTSIYHWMYYITLGRKMPHLNTIIFLWEWLFLNIMAGSVPPKFLVLTMWPWIPLGHGTGASVSLPTAKGQPRLCPECWNITVWRNALSNSHSSAPAYTKPFQTSIPSKECGKKYVVC